MSKNYIIMAHNSDLPIDNKFLKLLNNNQNITIYSQNIDLINKNVYSIPIGIANSMWKHGNVNIMHKFIEISKRKELINRNNKIYVNFTVETYPIYRKYVLGELSKHNFVDIDLTIKSYEIFLLNMINYKWIASPRGNGIDCHRTWEALYLGCIPLVDRNINNSFYNDLPLIYIDDWSNISYEYLQDKTDEIIKNYNNYNWNKLTIKYWENIINNKL
jgi:hypothetical protein